MLASSAPSPRARKRRAQIDVPHLLAAIAVWEYAEGSARYIFGKALGDAIADQILQALRTRASKGLTRTEIRDLVGRHPKEERIQTALDLLHRLRLATKAPPRATGGRPAEVWMAVSSG
jgi:hypothetical protein